MNKTTHIEVHRDADSGLYVSTEHVEWVPERPHDGAAYLPSTWRQPIGKELTDRAILRRAEEGWYGQEWKNKALARKKLRSVTASGMAIRCIDCGKEELVQYKRFGYLPTPGYYCPSCIAKHQEIRDRDENLRKRWKELMMKEYE